MATCPPGITDTSARSLRNCEAKSILGRDGCSRAWGFRLTGIADAGCSGWSRRDWQIACAQFFGVRQFVEIPQTEVLQEKLGRLVKQRAAGQFRAPADFDQAAFH